MRGRRTLAGGLAGLALTALVILWHAPNSQATANITPLDIEVASWANNEREWNGLPRLLIDGDLAAQAQLQARRMTDCGCLHHSPTGEMAWWLQRGWTRVGENVGTTSAPGIFALFGTHLAFVASPGHRANMLGDYKGIGTAVRSAPDGRQFVVLFFGGY